MIQTHHTKGTSSMLGLLGLLILLLAGPMAATAADSPPPIQAMKNAKLDKSLAVLEASGVASILLTSNPVLTALVPTNEAVDTFLSKMGIKLADLTSNKPLADALVAYHTRTRYALDAADIFSVPGDKVPVYMNARPYHVTFSKAAASTAKALTTTKATGTTQQQQPVTMMVTDTKGNTAKVLQTIKAGNAVLHVIDRVLYSGGYFNTLSDLFKHYPDKLSAAEDGLKKAGGPIAALLTQKGFPDTIFLSNNAAFSKAGLAASLQSASAADRVVDAAKFSIVKGRHTIPDGFKSGQAVQTLLPGATITVDFSKGAKEDFVVDGHGRKIDITKANLFVGNGVAHAVAALPLPKQVPLPAGAAAAATPAKAASSGHHHHHHHHLRLLLQRSTAPWGNELQNAEDGVATGQDAHTPAWAKASMDTAIPYNDLGSSSATREDADANDKIDAEVRSYDASDCC